MRKVVLTLALMLPFLMLFSGCGGEDLSAPSSTLTDAPDTLFYNSGNSDGTSTRVRFSGTATDNFSIDAVQISFNAGSTWKDATVSGTGSSKTWVYLATESKTSAASTIRTKAQDMAGNWETAGAGTAYTKTSSSVIGSLESIVTSATADDVIYLSSGTGGAYGDSSTATVLANSVDLIIMGSGYGLAVTSTLITNAGFSAVAATPMTSIATSQSASYLFSIGADLTLKNIRVSGAVKAVNVHSVSGTTVTVTVEDTVFENQNNWAIFATNMTGNFGSVNIIVNGVMIDAENQGGDSTDRGGIYLDKVKYTLDDTLIANVTGASSFKRTAIYANSGGSTSDTSITISGCYLVNNVHGIWIDNGSPVVTSCVIRNDGLTISNGVNLSTAGTPRFNSNTISGSSNYGVRVGGSMTPIFYRNIIGANGSVGVWVDGTGEPDLGTFPFDDSGCNRITNSAFQYDTEYVLVASPTTESADIFNAGKNFWGSSTYAPTDPDIYRIWDKKDSIGDSWADLSGTGLGLGSGATPVLWNGTATCP